MNKEVRPKYLDELVKHGSVSRNIETGDFILDLGHAKIAVSEDLIKGEYEVHKYDDASGEPVGTPYTKRIRRKTFVRMLESLIKEVKNK